jgi:hypothetical protein
MEVIALNTLLLASTCILRFCFILSSLYTIADGIHDIYFAVTRVGIGCYLSGSTIFVICGLILWFLPNAHQYMRYYNPVIAYGYPVSTGLSGTLKQYSGNAAAIAALVLSISLFGLSAVSAFIYFQISL